MSELLDKETLVKRLRYQGSQYQAGQFARGGGNPPHMLTQAADLIDKLQLEIDTLRQYGNKDCTAMADEALEQAQ